MRAEHYSGGLTREQFLYYEMRIVATLVIQEKSHDEIFSEIFYDNLFQFPTERMIKTITNTCFKRIDALDSPELVSYLASASAEVAKQINLYAIMCENSIVYDFMTEVIGEKYRSQQLDFSAKDVNVFFMELAEKVPAVNDWSESTVKKLKQVLVRFLVECEYLESPRSGQLLPVYLYQSLMRSFGKRVIQTHLQHSFIIFWSLDSVKFYYTTSEMELAAFLLLLSLLPGYIM